jgi:hypothetical protein
MQNLTEKELEALDNYLLSNPSVMNYEFDERVEMISKELKITSDKVEEYLLVIFSHESKRISDLYGC